MRLYQHFSVLKFLWFSQNRRGLNPAGFRENKSYSGKMRFFSEFSKYEVSQIFLKLSCSQFCWIRIKYKFFTENMRFFTEFFKSRVSAIFLEFWVSQFHRFWRKYEISEENGRLFFRICKKSEVYPLFFEYKISHSVIFWDNRELFEEIWKISQNFSENWKMRKSKIISEKFWEIFAPGRSPKFDFFEVIPRRAIQRIRFSPCSIVYATSDPSFTIQQCTST